MVPLPPPPKKGMFIIGPLEPVIVTSFRKRVFADVIKLNILKWDQPGVCGWVLNPMINVFMRLMGETM